MLLGHSIGDGSLRSRFDTDGLGQQSQLHVGSTAGRACQLESPLVDVHDQGAADLDVRQELLQLRKVVLGRKFDRGTDVLTRLESCSGCASDLGRANEPIQRLGTKCLRLVELERRREGRCLAIVIGD